MKHIYALLILVLLPATAQAQLLEWQSNNVQLLHGSTFELNDDPVQTTFTFEHANGWKYGDNFFYLDYNLDQSEDINAEFSPRLSAGKILGKDLSHGIFQDILLSGTYEKARRFEAFLYGVGVDLNIPGFSFFQTNWYIRDNPDANGTGAQTTWVWSRPFQIAGQKMTFDGYFDYADYEEGVSNFFTQPQLLLDIGHATGLAPEGKAFAGIEYRYWHNKFGVDGVTEIAPQGLVKFVF